VLSHAQPIASHDRAGRSAIAWNTQEIFMNVTFGAYYTLIMAVLVLMLGKLMTRHIRFLRDFNIPSRYPVAWSWRPSSSCCIRPRDWR
jgi:hypothetical protein